ncbi:MAG: sigma-70 family RNA polymerase sigma factor [Acidobacteriota bacterium]
MKSSTRVSRSDPAVAEQLDGGSVLTRRRASEPGWPRLLARARRGERVAFDRFTDELWAPLRRFFWCRVGPEDASELTQEVFCRVYRVLRSGGGPAEDQLEDWRRYLFRMARNAWIDHGRRRAVRPDEISFDVLFGEGGTSPRDSRGDDSEPSALQQLLDDETRTLLEDGLGRLEPEERTLCWSHFVDGCSKREIGRRLNRPESTIRVLMNRALAKLRAHLESQGLTPGA